MVTPRWLRVSVAALLFLSAVANMRKGMFERGPLLCLGLMFSAGVDRGRCFDSGEQGASECIETDAEVRRCEVIHCLASSEKRNASLSNSSFSPCSFPRTLSINAVSASSASARLVCRLARSSVTSRCKRTFSGSSPPRWCTRTHLPVRFTCVSILVSIFRSIFTLGPHFNDDGEIVK